MKIYSFDIDGTICSNTYGEYEKAIPFKERILHVNKLYNSGNTINLFTARGSNTGIDWYDFTKNQLSSWGVLYHKLILGKPDADIFIDDKGCNDEYWLWEKESKELKEELRNAYDFFSNTAISYSHISKDYELLEKINLLGKNLIETIHNAGIIFFAGIGDDFYNSKHICAKFIERFNKNRMPFQAIALGSNSISSNEIGNENIFEKTFAKEIESFKSKKDLLVILSASEESEHICKLIEIARKKQIKTALLTGPDSDNSAGKLCDLVISTPKNIKNIEIIQQIHLSICNYIFEEKQFKLI